MPAAKQCVQTRSFTPSKPRGPHAQANDIIDIRSNKVDFNLKDELISSLNPPDGGARRLPTLLLYDERGLQLFEHVRSSQE